MHPFYIFKAAVALSLFAMAGSAVAQDQVKTATETINGRIERVTGGNIVLSMGAGSRTIPLSLVKSVVMKPPAAYAQAIAAAEARDYQKALDLLRPAIDQYKGLPVDWAQSGLAMVGDLFVELNKPDRAELEYAEYEKFYPSAKSSERMAVMKAKVAFANKRTAEAKAALEPIIKTALAKKEVTRQEGATYGQVFLVMGQIYQSEKKLPAALESYLRTVTVFYQDPNASATAQGKADALRNANKTLVAP